MRICPKCNGAGMQFVRDSSFGGPCPSCMGTGREREPALEPPRDRITKLDAMTREQRIEWANAMVRVVLTARAVEAKMHVEARAANCDVLHDEHEQLRSALHNIDMLELGSDT